MLADLCVLKLVCRLFCAYDVDKFSILDLYYAVYI